MDRYSQHRFIQPKNMQRFSVEFDKVVQFRVAFNNGLVELPVTELNGSDCNITAIGLFCQMRPVSVK